MPEPGTFPTAPPAPATPLLARLDRDGLTRLAEGIQTTMPAAVFRIEGSGAEACLQGLLTNDVVQPGPSGMVYGALLTPKGMLVADAWVLRDPDGFTLVLPAEGQAAAAAIFRRSLPPRLATVRDQTGEIGVRWLHGEEVGSALEATGIGPLPEQGHTAPLPRDGGLLMLGHAPEEAFFAGVLVGRKQHVAEAGAALEQAGLSTGGAEEFHGARILAGWPWLGAEIVEKTLPQEVRYDALGGVSYTKGCYTGQETVARVHFRGHPNRELRGLRLDQSDPPTESGVRREGREVGRVGSILVLDDHLLALGMLRREVETGTRVSIGDHEALVVPLPFASPAG